MEQQVKNNVIKWMENVIALDALNIIELNQMSFTEFCERHSNVIETIDNCTYQELKDAFCTAQKIAVQNFNEILERTLKACKKYNRGLYKFEEVIDTIYRETTNLNTFYRELLLRTVLTIKEF